MRQQIILLTVVITSVLPVFAQTEKECSILDGTTDTVICEDKKMIVELSFCESTRLYQDGFVTDLNGKEEFCFFYRYDSKKRLKKITFWTYQWNDSKFVTIHKIGVLKNVGEGEKLRIKDGFSLSRDFVKLVTKI